MAGQQMQRYSYTIRERIHNSDGEILLKYIEQSHPIDPRDPGLLVVGDVTKICAWNYLCTLNRLFKDFCVGEKCIYLPCSKIRPHFSFLIGYFMRAALEGIKNSTQGRSRCSYCS